MTCEEFTGDLDPSGTRISRSSEFSVVNSTVIMVKIPHKAHINFYESGDYSQDNSLC